MEYIQFASIGIAFFALVIYTIFAKRFSYTPKGCYFIAGGLLFNAIQKFTIFRFSQFHWCFDALDHSILPFIEASLYAVGSIYMLIQYDFIHKEMSIKLKKHGDDLRKNDQ